MKIVIIVALLFVIACMSAVILYLFVMSRDGLATINREHNIGYFLQVPDRVTEIIRKADSNGRTALYLKDVDGVEYDIAGPQNYSVVETIFEKNFGKESFTKILRVEVVPIGKRPR